jgi:muramoyltetrapeptide carboxypeptidase
MDARRRFLNISVIASSFAAGNPIMALANKAADRKTVQTQSLVRPRRLRRGAVVALVNPGGVVTDDQIARAVSNAQSLGLTPRLGSHLRARYGGYAGTPRERAYDLHDALSHDEIQAIWSVRGGSGTAQVLPLIDYAHFKAKPKVLMGFSDMTALLNAVHHHAGLVTFHTVSGISSLTPYAKHHLEQVLFEGAAPHAMLPALEHEARAATEPEYTIRAPRAGVAEGALVGGNLAVFTSLIGTAYMPSLEGKILVLEDINEAPYRIDRMLTQLVQHMTHTKSFPAATVFGICRKCEATDGEASLTLQEVIGDYAATQRGPVASGYSFGHVAGQMALPIGVLARLDTEARTLTLLEPAVT